jgi:hypothetical protein
MRCRTERTLSKRVVRTNALEPKTINLELRWFAPQYVGRPGRSGVLGAESAPNQAKDRVAKDRVAKDYQKQDCPKRDYQKPRDHRMPVIRCVGLHLASTCPAVVLKFRPRVRHASCYHQRRSAGYQQRIPDPTKILSLGKPSVRYASPSLAWGCPPQSRTTRLGRCGFTLLANGAASADR